MTRATAPLGRVAALLRPYRRSLVGAGALGVLATGVALSEPLVIGWLIGRILAGEPALPVLVLLVSLFAVEAGVSAVQVYLLGRTGLSMVLDARHTVVRRLLRAPVSVHLDQQQGDLFSRVVTDTSLLRNSLAQGLSNASINGLMVLGCLVLMTIVDPWLTLAALLCVSVASVASLAVALRLRVAAKATQDRVGEFGAGLSRAIAAIRTVKLSRAEQQEEDRIVEGAEDAHRAGMRETRILAVITPVVTAGIQGSFAAVFMVGAYRLAGGALDTAMFAAFLLYLFYLIAPLVSMFGAVAQLQHGLASLMRIGSIVELDPEPTTVAGVEGEAASAGPRAGDTPPGNAPTVLELDGVEFGYQPDVRVLHGLTVAVPRRGLTAIVGPSGAGKSTVFALATRLWHPDAGRVLLDGRDTRAIPLAELRARISYVEQDAPLMDGTIHENLIYANPDASQAEIDRALEQAYLTEWVASLPDGLATPVGEAGAKVSGGERQRIALARTLLTSPQVLLLDEATSQLDSGAESALRRSIRAIAQERAVVATAHRMSTVVDASHIVVMDQGRLCAEGTHDELVATDDLYRSLVDGQLGTLLADRAPVASDRAPVATLAAAPHE